MPNCYYTCNLVPLDLMADRGYTPRWLGNHRRGNEAAARRDGLSIHPMTCPFVTKLVAAADELLANATPGKPEDRLVVAGGCDAMRRMGDLLAATHPESTFVLPVPRSSGPEVEKRLAADLRRLDEWLTPGGGDGQANGNYADHGVTKDPSAASETWATAETLAAAVSEPPSLDYPEPPRPGGVFVVAGPLSDDSLLRLIGRLGSHVSGLESCTSPDRWKPLAPTAHAVSTSKTADPAAAPAPVDYAGLAAQALAAGMCPRRSTADRRDHLVRRLDEACPSSVIYARQSFCDPGAYDALLVAGLAEQRSLPYLEIEVDFPFDANGPLRTRVEAFLEAQLLDDDLLGDLGDHDLFGEED